MSANSSLFSREEFDRLLEWFDEWDFADGRRNGADDLDAQIKAKIKEGLRLAQGGSPFDGHPYDGQQPEEATL